MTGTARFVFVRRSLRGKCFDLRALQAHLALQSAYLRFDVFADHGKGGWTQAPQFALFHPKLHFRESQRLAEAIICVLTPFRRSSPGTIETERNVSGVVLLA